MAQPKAVKRGSTRQQLGRTAKPPNAPKSATTNAPTHLTTNVGARSKKAMPTTSPAKRAPRKAAPRGKWSETTLLTSEKSVLVHADLVKLLASPEAWNCLDENDKREILALLPADTHPDAELQGDNPDAKIPPLPTSFLRYSNNWRDGIRQFQIDLENGRYDPEWLRQAENARKQRENGDFDSFKEREFEQFWGQKQNFDRSLLAGESAKIKLSQLIDHGVIQLGDIWRFRYRFVKPGASGDNHINIDKEARIDEIDGPKLSFTIPTGMRTFLSSAPPDSKKAEVLMAESDVKVEVTATSSEESTKEPAIEPNTKVDALVPSPSETPQSPSKSPTAAKAMATIEAPLGDDQASAPVKVIIMNQNLNPTPENTSLKRPTPQPESEPPAKRKRGRPRKAQPENKSNKEAIQSEQEVASSGLGVPASSGIAVEIVKSPYHSSESVSSEAIQSNKQTKELENSTETSPLTDIDMEESTTQTSPQALESSAIPGTTEQVNETNSPSTNEEKATHRDESANAEQQGRSSSPLSTAQSMADSSPNPKNTNTNTDTTDRADKSSKSEPLEVKITNVRSPHNVVVNMLKIDGRKPDGRTANAWKEIRCYRNNQDIGSLWELREAWYLKQG